MFGNDNHSESVPESKQPGFFWVEPFSITSTKKSIVNFYLKKGISKELLHVYSWAEHKTNLEILRKETEILGLLF